MKTASYLIMIASLIFFSCKEKTNPITSEQDLTNISKSWVNSYEEQNSDNLAQIFRPSDYKEFQLSRYREQLKFTEDSICSYLVLAPDDGHYLVNGKWSIVDQEKHIVAIYDSTGTVYKKFQIIELNQDLLKYVIID